MWKIFLHKMHLLPFILSLTLLWAEPAGAVQQHGGTEGLVSHEIGHILFIIGMGYLLFWVYRLRMTGAGWSEFKVFLWLILCWNFLTFSGHWMGEVVDPEKFIRINGEITGYSLDSLFDFFFYLTRLDHLVLVPSFFFLLLALKRWSHPA
jgi:hypothetical protein